jgi:hypothetical protein
MYLAALPVILTMRSSTVVNESSQVAMLQDQQKQKEARPPGVLRQMWGWLYERNFMLRQSAVLLVVVIVIAMIEDGSLTNDPNFSIFSLLYEISSAFGTVGLSLGYPNTVTSFSARWSVASKVLLCGVMLMGRHRGLPSELDSAVAIVSRRQDEDVSSQSPPNPTVIEALERSLASEMLPRTSFVLSERSFDAGDMVIRSRSRTLPHKPSLFEHESV